MLYSEALGIVFAVFILDIAESSCKITPGNKSLVPSSLGVILVLNCSSASSRVNFVNASWTRNGTPIEKTSTRENKGKTWIAAWLTNASSVQEGEIFECKISYPELFGGETVKCGVSPGKPSLRKLQHAKIFNIQVLTTLREELVCAVERGWPTPTLSWWRNGLQIHHNDFHETYLVKLSPDRKELTLTVVFISGEHHGKYTCRAENMFGNFTETTRLLVNRYKMVKWHSDLELSPIVVLEGQNITLECTCSEHECLEKTARSYWRFQDNDVARTARVRLSHVITEKTLRILMVIRNVSRLDYGSYRCGISTSKGFDEVITRLHVVSKEYPTAKISSNQRSTILEGDKLTLTCRVNEATSQIKWKKNNVSITQRANITKDGNRSILVIERAEVFDSGKYSCEALNKAGSASSSVDIKIRGLQEHRPAPVNEEKYQPRMTEWYIVGPISAVVLSVLIVWYLCKRRMTEMSSAEEENEMVVLNVEVDAWEISLGQIALEEVIGSGTFGTVWRATLSRKNGKPGIRFVAAKCFSPTSGDEGKAALMREIELGKVIGDSPQPNIVQFIGCVTNQIHPILIMEYLPRGDLLGYLRKSRGIFDKHYSGKLQVAPLKTYDLMSFSNQIATGMVFLASRGIIHRDLAARNVLLDKNRVCKVTDFGLSYRNFKYGHGNAKKGCMPIKWTAPEILFGDAANLSSKSDVWSYGVVLYEIFTIGGIPYPGWSELKTMEELKKGYRMPKPAHIANNLYNLMEMCWLEVPILRPDFVNISKRLRSFIEGEYLPLVDESKYDGAKYSRVEDVGAAAEDDARAVRWATNVNASKRKWSSLKVGRSKITEFW
ncbi:vascular endothelial growth factor receptor 1-like [Montipora foliosa]|uniref:vascular endothelial growth factor receptor 1-like n=1 Tax=Montipora foliosa TaxID=591990 RepID=UPI0035F1AA4B